MSPPRLDPDRFAALLGDDVAKEFVFRVCNAADENAVLTDAEQMTVLAFFASLGADFENAAANEREMDLVTMAVLFAMALPAAAIDPVQRRLERVLGTSAIAPEASATDGPWRLWSSERDAIDFVPRYVRWTERILKVSVKLVPERWGHWLFDLPERFHQHLEEIGRRRDAGEITDDPRGVRHFLRYEYLRHVLVGWDELSAARKAMLAAVPRLLLPHAFHAAWEAVEARASVEWRKNFPELWTSPERRWVGLYRAVRWLLDEHWPKRAPVLKEIGDASGKITFQLVQAALSNGPVLIVGEPGTGKDLAAQAIHQLRHGSTASSPYRPMNCGSTSKELIGSLLFGHERGAFTGAQTQRKGLFAEAENGTVFLDEIGEMPPDVQSELLRVLGSWKAMRVGSDREVDVRADVVAATNRDLDAMVKSCGFREDLFDRLSGHTPVRMVPLSERSPDDIAAIWKRLIAKAAQDAGLPPPDVQISPAEASRLADRGRKGNVRALVPLAERYVRWNRGLVMMDIEEFLARNDLSNQQGTSAQPPWPDPKIVASTRAAIEHGGDFDEVFRRLEDAVIAEAVAESGSLAQAAKRLGVDPKRLQKRRERLKPSAP